MQVGIWNKLQCLVGKHLWGRWTSVLKGCHSASMDCVQSRSCTGCCVEETRKIEHHFGPLRSDRPGSCDQSKVCDNCGYKDLIRRGHEFGEPTFDREGCCDISLTCRHCHFKKSIEVGDHQMGKWKYQARRKCQLVRVCKRCGLEEVGDCKHSFGEWAFSGKDECEEQIVCQRCALKIRRPVEHTFSDWYYESDQSCDVFRTCLRCSLKETSSGAHGYGDWTHSGVCVSEEHCGLLRVCEHCSLRETAFGSHDFADWSYTGVSDLNHQARVCLHCSLKQIRQVEAYLRIPVDEPDLPKKPMSYMANLANEPDEEIVRLAKNGDEFATEYLISKYRNFVRVKAKSYFLDGADREDIIQEGMIGLYKAIRDYRADSLSSFRAFAKNCITRQIITAIKTSTRQKHIPLNSYIRLNEPIYDEDSDVTMLNILISAVADQEEGFIPYEEPCPERHEHTLESRITGLMSLSALEQQVLYAFEHEGKSYNQIAEEQNRHMKSIENALQRARRKMGK